MLSGVRGRWRALEDQENAYEKSVRASHAHFERLENTLEKFAIRRQKLDAWLETQRTVFASGDYGGSAAAVRALLEAHSSYSKPVKTRIYLFLSSRRRQCFVMCLCRCVWRQAARAI